jgi:hypothetical protein
VTRELPGPRSKRMEVPGGQGLGGVQVGAFTRRTAGCLEGPRFCDFQIQVQIKHSHSYTVELEETGIRLTSTPYHQDNGLYSNMAIWAGLWKRRLVFLGTWLTSFVP